MPSWKWGAEATISNERWSFWTRGVKKPKKMAFLKFSATVDGEAVTIDRRSPQWPTAGPIAGLETLAEKNKGALKFFFKLWQKWVFFIFLALSKGNDAVLKGSKRPQNDIVLDQTQNLTRTIGVFLNKGLFTLSILSFLNFILIQSHFIFLILPWNFNFVSLLPLWNDAFSGSRINFPIGPPTFVRVLFRPFNLPLYFFILKSIPKFRLNGNLILVYLFWTLSLTIIYFYGFCYILSFYFIYLFYYYFL